MGDEGWMAKGERGKGGKERAEGVDVLRFGVRRVERCLHPRRLGESDVPSTFFEVVVFGKSILKNILSATQRLHD